ncbi:hypothetical protein [Pseudonocardia endophytica]|uniref:Uncharacterized protein n=1 Tax=Pseudonocardia endophytica TaxID=401976 RepID=A0A4R1IBC1_PSEEN|nr:hypothetical protein [Pseudonocardia endophytica]TCK27722.1 hypothetical protein EV378_3600 [Pseudonocardia endophytica]
MTRRADAVLARRTELEARRRRLAAGPRSDVGTVLALARLACADRLAGDLAVIRADALARIERARPAELPALHRRLESELAAVGGRLDRTFDEQTGPPLRRLAAGLCPGAVILPLDASTTGPDVLRAAAVDAPARRSFLADPRLIGALAGIPVLAAHGIGLAAALVAAGLVLLAGCVARIRTVDRERARLVEHVTRSVASATAAGEREIARRLIRTEAAVVAALDRAARARAEPVAV